MAAHEKTADGAYNSLHSSQIHSFFLLWFWISIHKVSVTVLFYTEHFEPCPYLLNGGNFIMISFIFPQAGVQVPGCFQSADWWRAGLQGIHWNILIAWPLSTQPVQIKCYWSVSLEPGTELLRSSVCLVLSVIFLSTQETFCSSSSQQCG